MKRKTFSVRVYAGVNNNGGVIKGGEVRPSPTAVYMPAFKPSRPAK